MSDLLSEAMEMSRSRRTSSLDPALHPTQIVKPDVCESCGGDLTQWDVVHYSLWNPATRTNEFYCWECSDVVKAIRRSRERESEHNDVK